MEKMSEAQRAAEAKLVKVGEKVPEAKQPEKLKCGIIMPISEIDGCSAGHWNEVLRIIKEALIETQFEPDLVSNANEAGVIQARIIKNLAENPIVICDVSGKNPNVMFELGMRLAFDLPTVVIKDDKTGYSFDTSPIEHVAYPRALTFFEIVEFKRQLASKVTETYNKASKDPNFSSFLGHFVQFTPKTLPSEELPATELILKELTTIKEELAKQKRAIVNDSSPKYAERLVATLSGNLQKKHDLFRWMMKRGVLGVPLLSEGTDFLNIGIPPDARFSPTEFVKTAESLGILATLKLTPVSTNLDDY